MGFDRIVILNRGVVIRDNKLDIDRSFIVRIGEYSIDISYSDIKSIVRRYKL